jgi:hypothetical protein
MIRKLAESALKYYKPLLVTVLAAFVVIDWFLIIPQNRELGVNLLTDSVFTIFTIIFLMSLIEYRENHQWKLVERRVKARIEQILYWILDDFTYLCAQEAVIHDRGMTVTTTKDYKLTKEMLKKLSSHAPKYVLRFERRRTHLSDIELRYANFLDAELTLSLMQIQDDLYEIIAKIERQAEWGLSTEEEINVSLSKNILSIVTEIKKILPEKLSPLIDRERFVLSE